MKNLKFIALCFLLLSCATSVPEGYYYDQYTPYQKASGAGGEGYTVFSSEQNGTLFHFVVFKGNTSTLDSAVKVYTRAASYSFCDDKGMTAIGLTEPTDYSKVKKKVGSYTTGGYTIGNYSVPTSVHVYDYEVKTPIFMMTFVCRKNLKVPSQRLILSQVDPVLLKDYVHDFQGGVLVKVKTEAAGSAKLYTGDVILNADNKRVTKHTDLVNAYNTEDDILKLSIIRNKQKMTLDLPLIDTISTIKAGELKVKKAICVFESLLVKEINLYRKNRRKSAYKRDRSQYESIDYKIPFCRSGMNTKNTKTL